MKRFTKLFLFLGAFFLIAHNCFADGFNSVYTKDGVNIIAVGNSGNVFRSGNGGGNYGSTTLGSADLKCVFAMNNNVWVGTVNGAYYSTDAGNNFTMTSVAGYTINSVYFVDNNTGWIVGTGGYLAKSTNGGVTYGLQNSTVAVNLNSVKFINANTGVICGNAGTILYTTNGGTTWTPKTSGTTNDLLCIDYKSPNAIATSTFGMILKSINDCSTWTIQNYNFETKSDVRAVSMVTPTQFYTGGGGGFIRRTNDAGATYSFQSNPMMAPLSAIYFYDANNGWAVSSTMNGVLFTNDGGATWHFQNGVTVSFNWSQKQAGGSNIGNGFCLNPLNRDVLYCVLGKTIYRSNDRGATWSNMNTINTTFSTSHSFIVSPLDTNIMLSAISNGQGSTSYKLMRTSDHGTTWTDILGTFVASSYGMPMEIDENNPTVLYLCKDTHVIQRSTDNGLTFNDWGNHTFRNPCDIAVTFKNSAIVLIGDGVTGSGQGDFWKSIDTGKTWTMVQTVTGTEIPMIATTNQDPNLVYHTTWSGGGYWRSTDDGSTFSQTSSVGSPLWATDIAKDDPTAVAYNTYGDPCYISTDNGTSFTTTSVGNSPGAGIYYYDKANLYLQNGGGVYKLNINYTVVTGNSQISSEIPKVFSLNQNFPNPFNPTTQIEYNVSKSSYVSIKVYDVVGNEVANMVNQNLSPGKYKIDFNAASLSSGVYFYSLFDNGSKVDTKKMILIK